LGIENCIDFHDKMAVVENNNAVLSQKLQNINRKGRKEFTQRTQVFECKAFVLCDPCEKPLRLCGKNTFETVPCLNFT
jgi:hypothetical protein